MKSLAWPFGGEDLLLRIAAQFEEARPCWTTILRISSFASPICGETRSF